MKADSIYSSIRNKMKKSPEIFNFHDFVELCDRASKNIEPVVLHYNDFSNFVAKNSTRKTKHICLPLLNKICEVQFRKGSGFLHFKLNFADDFKTVDFLNPKFVLERPEKRTELRGIPTKKKEGIVKLLSGVPAGKRKFWYDIAVNGSVSDMAENIHAL